MFDIVLEVASDYWAKALLVALVIGWLLYMRKKIRKARDFLDSLK